MKVLATLLSSVLAVVAAGHEEQGAISVEGFGVRKPSISATKVHANPSDVDTIAARLLGLDVEASIGKEHLPTGDVFRRPKMCLIVLVNGVTQDVVVSSQNNAPYLQSLFADDSKFVLPLDDAQNTITFDLKKALTGQFEQSMFAERFLFSSVDKDVEQLERIVKTYKESYKNLVNDEFPDIEVIEINSLADNEGQALTDGIQKIDKALQELNNELSKIYNGKLATQTVLFSGHNRADRRLQAEDTNKTTYKTKFLSASKGQDFLLHVWVSVTFIVIIYMVFCCIPWANELDPILYSSLGREDNKED